MTSWLLNVHWLVPVGIYIVAAYVGVRWLGKHLANQPDQLKRLLTNFSFCLLMATAFAFATGHLRFVLGVLAIGVLNGLANIQVWQATRTSLSKTSVLSFGDDIIAIVLSALIIGDARYLNTLGIVGVLLCLLAGISFWLHDRSSDVRESRAFYRQVAIYSVLWGVAIFATRYYAFNSLPVAEFVFNWYAGTFVTILLAFVWNRMGSNSTSARNFTIGEYGTVAIFAIGIVGCLFIEYWAFLLGPATAVVPILLTAEAIVPAIVGWTIWKEGALFDRWQWSFTAIALMGTIFLGISLPYNVH